MPVLCKIVTSLLNLNNIYKIMGICCAKDPRDSAADSKEIKFPEPTLNKDALVSEHSAKRDNEQPGEDNEEDAQFKQNATSIKSPKEEINVFHLCQL